jgi:hypothetical protein
MHKQMYKTAHCPASLVLGLYQLNCAILDVLRDRMQSCRSCKLL